MNEALQTTLKKLRPSGLTLSLNVRLQQAFGNGLNHAEFLELILQDELAVRAERLMNRRTKAAAFRDRHTVGIDLDLAATKDQGLGNERIDHRCGLHSADLGSFPWIHSEPILPLRLSLGCASPRVRENRYQAPHDTQNTRRPGRHQAQGRIRVPAVIQEV